MHYSYDFLVNKDHLDLKKLNSGSCAFTFLDFLDTTSYVDVDEDKENALNNGITLEFISGYHNIEHPSRMSP